MVTMQKSMLALSITALLAGCNPAPTETKPAAAVEQVAPVAAAEVAKVVDPAEVARLNQWFETKYEEQLQMSPLHAGVMILVVYGVGQLLESFLLTPRLVGERIGLHPLAVIFALLAFGQSLGFVGVLIALPASAVMLVAWHRVRDHYLASRLYQG